MFGDPFIVLLRGRWILWLRFTLIGLMIDDRRGCTGLHSVIDRIGESRPFGGHVIDDRRSSD